MNTMLLQLVIQLLVDLQWGLICYNEFGLTFSFFQLHQVYALFHLFYLTTRYFTVHVHITGSQQQQIRKLLNPDDPYNHAQ